MEIKIPPISRLLDLADFPHSYVGFGTNALKVNSGETGIEFSPFSGGSGTIVGITGTFAEFNTAVTDAELARTDAAQTFTGAQTFTTPIAASSLATMTATVGGAVPTPPNNTTTFLRGDGTFATPSGGGGGSAVSGQATVNFGAVTQEDSYASVTVLEASVASGSIITVSPSGASTSDHDPDDYQWDNIWGYVSNIIAGVSFDIIGVAPNGSWGQYKFNYVIN